MTDNESTKLDKLYSAFFERPPGMPESAPTLIEELHEMAVERRRWRWLRKGMIWVVITVAGGVAALFKSITSVLSNIFPS